MTASWAAAAPALLSENFADDPVAGARATVVGDGSRFTFNAAGQTLTAAYDTLLPTSRMQWQLPGGTHLTQNDSFSFQTSFLIHSAGFFADPFGYAQISFGLINSATTGLDRTGTPADATSDDCLDVATVDYFPNLSTFFPSPNVQPLIIESDDGNPLTDAFVGLHYPTSLESALNGPGEADLPRDILLTAAFSYNASTGRVTLTLDQNSSPLTINSEGEAGIGGLDGDIATIQFDLPGGAEFDLDAFSILLWQDGWTFGSSSVTADVTFESFAVFVPEPGAIALLAVSLLALWRRK
ncbi:MAG: PEP-CTERM sorting domain-containing protein [Phycisphaeraceae bacterium]|nr:PEP-CTERM sorting domain-containing protein [Phycisphaeraceae bacterium]